MGVGKKGLLYKPWKELKKLQDAGLRRFLTTNLYPFSKRYRSLFDKNKIKPDSIKTSEDLKRIPFTSKEDFISEGGAPQNVLDFFLAPDETIIKNYLPGAKKLELLTKRLLRGKAFVKNSLEREYSPIFLTATTGTTGQPVAFLYSSYDLDNLKLYGRRMIEIFGVQKSDRMLNAFPYAPHLAFWQTVFAGLSANLFVVSTGGGKTIGTEGNIKSLVNLRPNFLVGVPSYVYHILKTAHERNLKMNFLKNIALGAARVPMGFKKKVAEMLRDMGSDDVRVLGTYGFTEARAAWGECPTDINVSSGYHVYPDKGIFEIVDPDTGEAKGEGEPGELVYTGIDCRGTAVVRYRTGDLVKGGITYAPCPHCGRTVPRISSDITRASNVKNLNISKIKGTLVNMNDLEWILDDNEEIDEWQIEIAKKDDDPYEVDLLNLYLSFSRDVDKAKFSVSLKKKISTVTEITFNKIAFLKADEMRDRIEIESAMKAKKIVDKRP